MWGNITPSAFKIYLQINTWLRCRLYLHPGTISSAGLNSLSSDVLMYQAHVPENTVFLPLACCFTRPYACMKACLAHVHALPVRARRLRKPPLQSPSCLQFNSFPPNVNRLTWASRSSSFIPLIRTLMDFGPSQQNPSVRREICSSQTVLFLCRASIQTWDSAPMKGNKGNH